MNKLICFFLGHHWIYRVGTDTALRFCVTCDLHQTYVEREQERALLPGTWRRS